MLAKEFENVARYCAMCQAHRVWVRKKYIVPCSHGIDSLVGKMLLITNLHKYVNFGKSYKRKVKFSKDYNGGNLKAGLENFLWEVLPGLWTEGWGGVK